MKKSTLLRAGQKFGRLTVIKLNHIEKNVKNNIEHYECICDCGDKCIILKRSLKSGKTKSCGCLQKEKAKINGLNNKIHGLTNTRLFNIWNGIKRRCYNKNNNFYYNYGGRGITVCNEWLDKDNGFINFYNWAINNGYKEDLTIDRIDNNGNYEPSNCRWSTVKEQARNRRTNYLITYNEETHCIAEWADILKIKGSVICSRINHNWSIEKSFTIPVKK